MSSLYARSLTVVAVGLIATAAVPGQEPVRLRETFSAGNQYRVGTRVEMEGTLSVPMEMGKAAKPLAVKGASAIDYDERLLEIGPEGETKRLVRIYRKYDLQRKVGLRDQQSTIRPEVRRVVVMRRPEGETTFSPDGPLIWGEIDLVRADLFTPALVGLLPEQPVKPGDRWKATPAAVRELTDLEGLSADSGIDLRLDQVTTINGRQYARVTFGGVVKGTSEDGPNRQHLDGFYLFDLESRHLAFVSLDGKNVLLDPEGKEVGKIDGRYTLTRTLQTSRDLDDASLRGLALEPNVDNTRLLYDNVELGVRFEHPRRWRMGLVSGRQVTLDAPDGCGLLISVESLGKLPTAAQFQNEARTYLQNQKDVKVTRIEPAQRVTADLERFALEMDAKGNRVRMEYWILRQAKGGFTMAGRIQGSDAATIQKEIDGVLRTLTLTKTIE